MTEDQPKEAWVTIAEAALLLDVSPDTVRRRAKDRWRGFPPSVQFGPRDHRLAAHLLQAWLDDQFRRAVSSEEDDGC